MGGTTASGAGVPSLSPATFQLSGTATGSGSGAPARARAAASSLDAALAQLRGALDQLAGSLSALAGAATLGAGPSGGGGGCGCQGSAPASNPTNASLEQVLQRRDAPPAKGSVGGAKGAPEATSAQRDDPPATGGDARQRIVDLARQELAKGVTEDAGSDKDKDGRIRTYRSAVTGRGENPDAAEAWCADFASWLWKQAGVPWGPDGKGDDYTVSMVDHAKKSGTWKQRDPKPGDMVFIDWQGGNDVDHVAIVERVENGRVHTIAGNEGDRVKSASYRVGDSKLMGFVSPKGA